MKFLAGALLLSLASVATVASAQSSTLVGGGATLPAVGYVGDTSTRLVTPTSDSLFGAYAALAGSPAVSYCQTGSGGGKTILAGNNPALNVNGTCTDPSIISPPPPSVTGFGAASLGLNLAQPHFDASDAPMSQAEYTNYRTGHSSVGQPVQLPSISGAIAIVYQKNDLATQLQLTDAQVCGIFSGQITDWSALDASVSGPIKVVFRSDGSGTSFAFSNHLSKVCGSNLAGGTGGNNVATDFVTDQAWSTAAAAYISHYVASQGASGNPGVINAILDGGNDGAIGYAETANAATSFVSFAAVARDSAPTTFIDPTTYGGTVLPVALQFNKVITGVDGNGRPVLGAVTPALTTQCLSIVDPENYATTASGYPIIAVSYMLANSAGNGSDLANVQGLMTSPYNTALRSSVDTIGANTGLSYVSNADLSSTKVNACVVN